MVIVVVRERLSVGKLAAQNSDKARLHLKKVNDVGVKEQFRLKYITVLQF
jgi:hypothetical protein